MYYEEIDPIKRKEYMPDDDFVRELYYDRYSDHENKGRKNVDWWLWRSLCLQMLYSRGKFFRSFRDREVDNIIKELRMTDSHGDILYKEYRNVCRRYLSTCKSGDYASSFMGFRKAGDEEKIIRACRDVWQMSSGVAKSSGKTQEMKLWIEALRDELFSYDDICEKEYERLEGK